MPVPILTANGKDFQPRDPVARARQSIADLDAALGPLDDYRAELQAKPKPQHQTALMDAIRAKHPEVLLTDEELEIASHAWRCTECDEIHLMPRCCGAPLIRAGVRFFSEHPEKLRQFKEVKSNGHATPERDENQSGCDENGSSVGSRGRPTIGDKAMTGAERMRRLRAKKAGAGLINELFPKGSPACDIDWEAHDPGGDAEQHARAARWQLLEGERLAVEFAMLRDGVQPGDIKKTTHIKAVRKIARHWMELAEKLERMRRP